MNITDKEMEEIDDTLHLAWVRKLRIAALEAENKRLREALEDIAGRNGCLRGGYHECMKIADDVLNETHPVSSDD